jgi:transcriptional regulator with XRE-family HTH domain
MEVMSANPKSRTLPAESSLREVLGRRIAQARRRHGWSQAELAGRLETSREQVGNWERGVYTPTVEALVKLVESLEVTFEELLRGVPPPPAEIPREQRNELTRRFNALGQAMRSLLQAAETRKRKP